jgi:hypothetical protein
MLIDLLRDVARPATGTGGRLPHPAASSALHPAVAGYGSTVRRPGTGRGEAKLDTAVQVELEPTGWVHVRPEQR